MTTQYIGECSDKPNSRLCSGK